MIFVNERFQISYVELKGYISIEGYTPPENGFKHEWVDFSSGKFRVIPILSDDEKLAQKKAIKESTERLWRDKELSKVISRIDQYEKDQSYPVEFRTSPIKDHSAFLLLLTDRKVLSDYPDLETFPFGNRPALSGLAD